MSDGDDNDWMGIGEAGDLLWRATNADARVILAGYAASGDVRSRASSIRLHGEANAVLDARELTQSFWTETLEAYQDSMTSRRDSRVFMTSEEWQVNAVRGVFEHGEQFLDATARGVELLRSDLPKVHRVFVPKVEAEPVFSPPTSPAVEDTPAAAALAPRKNLRVPTAEWWPQFVAELVLYVRDEGLPVADDTLIKKVCERLYDRTELEAGRTSVQPVIAAVRALLDAQRDS